MSSLTLFLCFEFSILPRRGTTNQPRATPWGWRLRFFGVFRVFDPAPKGRNKSAQGNALGSHATPWLGAQRPWLARHRAFHRPQALKGRHNRRLFRPFRAEVFATGVFLPGRCPGLLCGAPSGQNLRRATSNPGRCPGLLCRVPSGQDPKRATSNPGRCLG
jgi:hypothetical protein